MELQPYLGNKLLTDIKNNVVKDIDVFNKQSDATKLQLATSNKMELEMYKQGTTHLIKAFDETAKELENAEIKVDYYQKQYGEVNQEYVKQYSMELIIPDQNVFAKKSLTKYMDNYDKEHADSNTNKK